MYIDPEECIDCGACEPECPVDAIYDEDEVPDEYETSNRRPASNVDPYKACAALIDTTCS